MITPKVKALKKSDWQEIAKKHGISFEDQSTIRYLVEKVAEKIGVDDKIVKDDDLKQAVHDKLEEIVALEAKEKKAAPKKVEAKKTEAKKAPKKASTTKKISKPKVVAKKKLTKQSSKKVTTKAEPKKEEAPKPELTPEQLEETRRDYYREEALRLDVNFGLDQTSEDILKLIQFATKNDPARNVVLFSQDKLTEVPQETKTEEQPVDKLSQLRYEVSAHGGAWGEAHTETDLQQLLTALQSAGVVPNYEGIKKPETLKQGSFELKTDNIEEIKENAPAGENITPEPFNPISQLGERPTFLQEQPVVSAPVTSVDEGQLIVYKDVFLGTIKNHFRLLSYQEVLDLFKQASYPFTHAVNRHPEQQNKVEIILTSGENSIRVPSNEKTEWIDING